MVAASRAADAAATAVANAAAGAAAGAAAVVAAVYHSTACFTCHSILRTWPSTALFPAAKAI